MVVAKNDAGEATVSCNVSVKGRLPHETSDSEFACSDMEPVVPKIQMPLKDLKVQEGRSVRLDCVIVGQPEPEVNFSRMKNLSILIVTYLFFILFERTWQR